MHPQSLKHIRTLTLTLLCSFVSAIILGQSEASKSGPPAPNMDRTPPDLSLPIDSGLLLLSIAGLGYGIYVATKRMKTKNISQ